MFASKAEAIAEIRIASTEYPKNAYCMPVQRTDAVDVLHPPGSSADARAPSGSIERRRPLVNDSVVYCGLKELRTGVNGGYRG